MQRFIVRDDQLETGFSALSKQLPASIVNNTLYVPAQRGSGLIKSIFLEEGLFIRYTHLTYYEDVEIIRLERQSGSEIIFALCFLLTPDSLKLTKPFLASSAFGNLSHNLFVTNNNMRLSAQIPEGTLSHTIELLFSREWLDAHLEGMTGKTDFFTDTLLQEEPPTVISGVTRPTEQHLLGEIQTELEKPVFNLLRLRSRALMVLADVLHRLPDQNMPHLSAREAYHVDTIRQVEQRLLQNLENMLPSQKQLAKEFGLSESTLKRHFKAIYGKTMYEYYLEKKMDLAKWFLQEKKISVSETAYMLGYEKVSAFSTIFKKYHKVLPSSLK